MKKLISLLLVLVLSLGLLSGITFAADMPAEAAQADAGVKVTFSGSKDEYYFPNLTREVILWACQAVPGAPTFTALKDLTIVNAEGTEGSARNLEIPANNADWYEAKQPVTGKLPVTFDLGGHTLTYSGMSNMIHTTRWGFTVKNGTMIYNGEKEGRAIFVAGGTTGAVANSSATSVYAPEIVLEDVTCISTGAGNPVLVSYLYATKIQVEDSVLWSEQTAAMNIAMSDQSMSSGTLYEGEYKPEITIKNSVVGSGKHYVFSSTDTPGCQVKITDTVLVTNHSNGNMLKSSNPMALDVTQDLVENAQWTAEAAGKTLAGKAYVIGKDPLKVELPFTDVKEGDWFYSFVSEMYGKKIIAGQTATTFNPNGNLTYGAALKLLTVGVTGKDAGNAASGHWATNYLNEAVAAGWTTIGADKLDAPVTREAFCEIAAKAKNLTEKAENPFKDTTNDAVLALVKAGVISGMSADTFAPQGVLTRAQIAKIISLLIKL